ncbi:MAG: cyclic-di-AMP receptor [Anaerolineales bacterium]
MKLVLAIVNDEDAESVLSELIGNEFRVTRIASTGGFLRRGNTTLLIGVEDEKVDQAIDVIRNATIPTDGHSMFRATVFVLPVSHFEQF